jgi:hypothetical protein
MVALSGRAENDGCSLTGRRKEIQMLFARYRHRPNLRSTPTHMSGTDVSGLDRFRRERPGATCSLAPAWWRCWTFGGLRELVQAGADLRV